MASARPRLVPAVHQQSARIVRESQVSVEPVERVGDTLAETYQIADTDTGMFVFGGWRG